MTKLLMIHPKYRDYRSELFARLSEHFNIEFLFIVEYLDEPIPSKLSSKIKCRNLNLKDKRFLPNDSGPGLGLLGSFHLIYLLFFEFIKNDAEIIITSTENPFHSKLAFIFSKLMKKKIIIWSETWKIPKKSKISRIFRILPNYILKNADAILVHGNKQKEYCIQIGIDENNIFRFNHCALDKSKENVNENKLKQIKKTTADRIIILFVGRMVKQKGVEILLHAFNKLEDNFSNIHLLLIGDGDYKSKLMTLSKKLQIKNVDFIGFVEPDQLNTYYYASDIFCLPSYMYNGKGGEGWGLVLNEAMSMALPIVTTDAVGGSSDLVKDWHNGFIVKNGNINSLYEALKTIISDNYLLKEMSKNSRKIFQEFNNYDEVINNFSKAIKHVES